MCGIRFWRQGRNCRFCLHRRRRKNWPWSGGVSEIRRRIETLREPYRQVCRLYFLEEKKPEEIALALGRPVKTVHTQIARARQILRSQLERREDDGTVS